MININITEIINNKKYGHDLLDSEIRYVVEGYTNGTIPDYQMSALLMAIYFQGMTTEESAMLTTAMVHSGDTINFPAVKEKLIDKHSTGGVGDKVSLIAVPLLMSLDISVVKMSGRGLGYTGGTIDKLESITGFKTELSIKQIEKIVGKSGAVIINQTANITPADKKLYALRDVTGTVDSLPLIASSIMSKKIATGTDGIVLDVKVGDGAFMKSVEDARLLSHIMIDIGASLNIPVVVVLTSMDEPLGKEIGNINEVQEVARLLQNKNSDANLLNISLTIVSQMAKMSDKYKNTELKEIVKKLEENIENGQAYIKFCEWIESQGGDVESIFNRKFSHEYIIKSDKSGYVNKVHTQKIGEITSALGAGRESLNDKIDYHAGVTLEVKLGDYVEEGQVLLRGITNKNFDKNIKNEMSQVIEVDKDRIKYNLNPILDIIQ